MELIKGSQGCCSGCSANDQTFKQSTCGTLLKAKLLWSRLLMRLTTHEEIILAADFLEDIYHAPSAPNKDRPHS